MNEPVIRVQGLSVVAGRRRILEDVSFSIGAGERVIIVGPNGAGKSSLLKTLSGITAPDAGTVNVLGQRLHGGVSRAQLHTLRAAVGQVFQGLHLVGRLTVEENVLIGGLARNRSPLTWARVYPRSEHGLASEALAAVNMTSFARVRADRLSGGERQKVAIARALMQQPRLLLADEPTASLDPFAAQDIADLLGNIALARGLTLITVVHTLSLLPRLGERVIGLKAGRVCFDLRVEEISETRLQALYAGASPSSSASVPIIEPAAVL